MVVTAREAEAPFRSEDWRYELKYRLDCVQYRRVRNAITPYMALDRHSRIAPSRRYLVRSLYFDTYDYTAFAQKMAGDDHRVKYRLRSYSPTLSGAALVRAELKVRKANVMAKHGAVVSPAAYLSFMERRRWPETSDPVLEEFERCLHLLALEPLVLIEYLREGFEDRARGDLRITFDHRVRSAHSASLFPEGPVFFRTHHPLGIVLEIKGRHDPPAWLRRLVRVQGLELIANSKFTQGILAARHDLYHPGGVVVIR